MITFLRGENQLVQRIMRSVNLDQVVQALKDLNMRQGEGILVHSALQYLGQPTPGIEIYLEGLLQVIGPEGTIAVPTFSFAFARGERYDPTNTPSEKMGVFSEFVRVQPGAMRTSHPMQSIASLGKYAKDLALRDTSSAFDPGSAFDRMLNLDFSILLLGADINAVSLLHYSEQRAKVPYRYWKNFRGEIMTEQGWQTRTYRMFVRDLELDPRIDLKPVQESLERKGKWHSVALNYGFISLCRMADFVQAVDEFLKYDPWSLVTNPISPGE